MSWERSLAESLTNAGHMRDLRQRIDIAHEERLRRRQREREDAEVRRAARKIRTPIMSDKFKTRSYDRPWAIRTPETRKPPSSPSDSSNTASSKSGSLPAITSTAQRQCSETSTPQTRKLWRHNRHPGNKASSQEDSLLANKDRRVRTRTRKPLPSGSSACYERECLQYPSRLMETPACPLASRSKPALTTSREPAAIAHTHDPAPLPHNREPAPLPHAHEPAAMPPSREPAPLPHAHDPTPLPHAHDPAPLPHAGHLPRLPSLRSSLSGALDVSDTDHSTSGGDSSLGPQDGEVEEAGGSRNRGLCHSSSTIFARGATESWLSSGQPTGPLFSPSISSSRSHISSTSSSSSTSHRGPLLERSPRMRLSPLDALSWDVPCLEPTTSGSEGEEELSTLRRGDWVVGRRGALSPSTAAAAASSSRGDIASSRPTAGALGEDVYAAMPSLEPIPEVAPAEAANTSTPASATRALLLSHRDPRVMAGPPGASQSASLIEAAAMLELWAIGRRVAMQEMRWELLGFQRRDGHGNTGNNDTETGNASGNGNALNRENRSSGNGNVASAAETKPRTDAETLRRITQSLLEESEEEEEGELCRICQCGVVTPTNPLLSPCQCSGTLQYIHQYCLIKWIKTKIESDADMSVVTTCELCKATLKLDLPLEWFCQYAKTRREVGRQLLLLNGRFSGLVADIQAEIDAVAQILVWSSAKRLWWSMAELQGSGESQREVGRQGLLLLFDGLVAHIQAVIDAVAQELWALRRAGP